jgi:hypothetical protein
MRLHERNTKGEVHPRAQKFISVGAGVHYPPALAVGFGSDLYLFGKIKSSSKSARAFSSEAITASKSVTEIIP